MTKDEISTRLKIETAGGLDYVFIDYSNLREKDMIELITHHRELTIQTKLPFIADFHNTFVTPAYMIHAKHFMEATRNIISKGAILGVNQVKSFILKGAVLTYHVNYQAFGSKEKAIEFLAKND